MSGALTGKWECRGAERGTQNELSKELDIGLLSPSKKGEGRLV